MKTILATFASLLIAVPALAQPLTTAFTYQGQLMNGATPVSGVYDLKFILFDNLTAGSPQGPQLCVDNLTVTGGLINVQLDFGSVFTGAQRFLQVQVRRDSG